VLNSFEIPPLNGKKGLLHSTSSPYTKGLQCRIPARGSEPVKIKNQSEREKGTVEEMMASSSILQVNGQSQSVSLKTVKVVLQRLPNALWDSNVLSIRRIESILKSEATEQYTLGSELCCSEPVKFKPVVIRNQAEREKGTVEETIASSSILQSGQSQSVSLKTVKVVLQKLPRALWDSNDNIESSVEKSQSHDSFTRCSKQIADGVSAKCPMEQPDDIFIQSPRCMKGLQDESYIESTLTSVPHFSQSYPLTSCPEGSPSKIDSYEFSDTQGKLDQSSIDLTFPRSSKTICASSQKTEERGNRKKLKRQSLLESRPSDFCHSDSCGQQGSSGALQSSKVRKKRTKLRTVLTDEVNISAFGAAGVLKRRCNKWERKRGGNPVVDLPSLEKSQY